jgi:hypothetical protein
MAINKNHEFEDLDGVKCAVVEKNVSASRVAFLKPLLEFNGFTVVIAKSPPPKVVAPKVDQTVEGTPPVSAPPEAPETFTVGVTEVAFNATNAIFGRLLRTPGGHIVTLAYWNQLDNQSHDEIPYYQKG